jgi:hypothetical protein
VEEPCGENGQRRVTENNMELKICRVKRDSKMKIRPTVFWGVTPCNLVEVYQKFGGILNLYLLP